MAGLPMAMGRLRDRCVVSGRRAFSTMGFDNTIERRFTGSIKYDKYAECRDSPEMKYQDVIPMWVADMDVAAPKCVTDAIIERAQHNVYGYAGPDFSDKGAIVSYLKRQHGVECSPSQLVFLPGLVVALNIIGRMAKADNQSIMTCTPVYPPFLTCARNSGVDALAVPLKFESGFKFDFDAMEQAVQNAPVKPGIFLLCNPHNPVGRSFDRAEILKVGQFCKKHDMTVVSDEVHCDLILNPSQHQHTPFLSLASEDPYFRERTIALYAPSKTYNIAGLTVAFGVIPDGALRAKFKKQSAGIMADINIFGYVGMKAVYEDKNGECAQYRKELTEYISNNVQLVQSFCEKHSPLLQMKQTHQATYLVWVDARGLQRVIQEYTESKLNAAKWLEQNAGVGFNDGVFFGPNKDFDGFIRINCGCPRGTVETALQRVENAIASLPQHGSS